MRYVLVSAAMLAAAPALADTMDTAMNLGTLLAAGQACGYTYDTDAVTAFVREHVPADDLGFAPLLSTMTVGAKAQLDGLSDAALIAQCAAAEQSAKHYGLMN